MVRVQTVSKDQLTFVVVWEKVMALAVGQQSLFSTRKFLLLLEPLKLVDIPFEVSENDSIVPFKKGQTISYSKELTLSSEIPSCTNFKMIIFHKEKSTG